MSTDPKMQAFLEDLVAVYAKHGKYVEYDGLVVDMEPDFKFAVIDSKGDILFGDADPREADEESDWDTDEPFKAVATIPATAHARLAAAARVSAIRTEQEGGWNTDVAQMAQAVAAFETALPGWWWSVGMCSVGAHASCAVDGHGPAGHLLDGVKGGHPFDVGFHCDTSGGRPHEALEDVMQQALEYLKGATP